MSLKGRNLNRRGRGEKLLTAMGAKGSRRSRRKSLACSLSSSHISSYVLLAELCGLGLSSLFSRLEALSRSGGECRHWKNLKLRRDRGGLREKPLTAMGAKGARRFAKKLLWPVQYRSAYFLLFLVGELCDLRFFRG